MDNTQIIARDGSWFLFDDWQGVTRIALPGDKVKTDCMLDRPIQDKPLVLRANGLVWLEMGVDVDPVALKKVRPAVMGHDSPDPLDGPDLAVGACGESVKVRDQELAFVPSGAEIDLGGTDGRRQKFAAGVYNVLPDGSLIVFGTVDKQTVVTFVTREPDGSGRVAWCRPIARVPYGDPDAFRVGTSVLVVDRDIVSDVAWLAEVRDDGTVVTTQTSAVAGPWVLDGRVWWQPNKETVCAGESLGQPLDRFELPAEHAGRGRLLRLSGRKLFLPFHGVSVIDLAPAKKGKGELSRKHKAGDEPMYRAAAQLLEPIREAMARRGARVAWRGVVRSGKRVEPKIAITGRTDLLTYLLSFSLQDGASAALASQGVTQITVMGGYAFDGDPKAAAETPTTADDVRQLIAMLDAAGINRASGFAYIPSLAEMTAQHGTSVPWTEDAEALGLAATLSGIRGDATLAPATPEALANVAPMLGDYDEMQKAGISTGAGIFLALAGHRRFGAEAVAPILRALEARGASYPAELRGQPVTPAARPAPPVPPAPDAPLHADEARAVAELETVLGTLGLDARASRESRGWYRFAVDGLPFQAGLNDGVRVLGTLCKTATDVDLDKLVASLERANTSGGLARFVEADGYINAKAACALSEADGATLKALVDACRDAITSEAGRSLKIAYRTED